MPYDRYRIDLAIDVNAPVQVKNRVSAWILATRAILPDAEIINPGLPEQENTRLAKHHVCSHDLTPNGICVETDI